MTFLSKISNSAYSTVCTHLCTQWSVILSSLYHCNVQLGSIAWNLRSWSACISMAAFLLSAVVVTHRQTMAVIDIVTVPEISWQSPCDHILQLPISIRPCTIVYYMHLAITHHDQALCDHIQHRSREVSMQTYSLDEISVHDAICYVQIMPCEIHVGILCLMVELLWPWRLQIICMHPILLEGIIPQDGRIHVAATWIIACMHTCMASVSSQKF